MWACLGKGNERLLLPQRYCWQHISDSFFSWAFQCLICSNILLFYNVWVEERTLQLFRKYSVMCCYIYCTLLHIWKDCWKGMFIYKSFNIMFCEKRRISETIFITTLHWYCFLWDLSLLPNTFFLETFWNLFWFLFSQLIIYVCFVEWRKLCKMWPCDIRPHCQHLLHGQTKRGH